MDGWKRRVLFGGVAALMLVVAVPALTVMPLFRDDSALDGVVVAVALDWRDFGAESAQERLQYELDHHGIGAHVKDEDCLLSSEADDVRQVRCMWSVDVRFPLLSAPVPMHFESVARVDRNGVLSR